MEEKRRISQSIPSQASFSLTKGEEDNLSEIIQIGLRDGASEEERSASEDAALILASANSNRAKEVAYRDFYYLDEATKQDLSQEGFLAMIELAKTYDPNKGARFSTYIQLPLRKRYQNYLRENDILIGEDTEYFPSPVEDKEDERKKERSIKALSGALNHLSDKQKEAIGRRFGLFGFPLDKTYRRIGEEMGISAEASRRLVFRALGKIRHHI